MKEFYGIGKGNHIPKLEALYLADPRLWGQIPSFIVHHEEDCAIFSAGECNCDPQVEFEKVDYQTS